MHYFMQTCTADVYAHISGRHVAQNLHLSKEDVNSFKLVVGKVDRMVELFLVEQYPEIDFNFRYIVESFFNISL